MDLLEFSSARLSHDPGTPSDCFLDIVVNGRSLKAHLDERLLLTASTPLASEWVVSEALLWLDSLTDGDGGELDGGRVPLYVCGICGDVTCGALSASVERDESLIRWSDFGWEETSRECHSRLSRRRSASPLTARGTTRHYAARENE